MVLDNSNILLMFLYFLFFFLNNIASFIKNVFRYQVAKFNNAERIFLQQPSNFRCVCLSGTLSVPPPLLFPICVHKSGLYVCIFTAAWQRGSSVPSF